MSRVFVTVNFNNALDDNSRRSMRDAAARWDADFWEMNEDLPFRMPTRANAYKCTVFEKSEYDEAFILDADTLVSIKCPNPFEEFTGPELIAVQNGSKRFGDLGQVKSAERWEVERLMSRDKRFSGVNYDPAFYFNTGMMVVRRNDHAGMFKLALDVCHTDHQLGWCDQTPINMACLKLGVQVRLVPEKWNYIHGKCMGDGWMDMPSKDVYVYHFAGEPGREHVIPKVKWK